MGKRVESPSSINTFKQCPRKYYYQYIAKLPTLPNIHQVRGNIAHSALENFYELDAGTLTPENYPQQFRSRIQSLFVQTWGKYTPQLHKLGLSRDQEKFYFEETLLMLLNWTNQAIDEMTLVLAKNGYSVQEAFQKITPLREQHFRSDHYAVRGFVDAIRQIDDEVHIIDYKTNSSFEFKDELKLQLAIYSLLYFEKNGKIPSKVGIFFLRHKLKLMPVDNGLLELAKKEIELVHTHTSASEDPEHYPRCPSGLCKWSTGQCDFYEVCKPFEKSMLPPANSSG
ncbi:PD-(D/E)XK nuclease family protein [Candidatus Woesearchaeota archaeon]|nr:PD-(D/E)XK nuclease family protein [Candidatus Woesearchaeota archaeon]